MTNKNEAVNLINKMLLQIDEKSISPNEIEKYDASFITRDYHNREADIIYRDKNDKDRFYLIEHQTTVDYRMPLRILEYYNEIVRKEKDYKKITKDSKFPIILSMVLYTGKTIWNAKRSLQEGQPDVNYKLKAPKLAEIGTYMLYDINKYTDEELLKEKGILIKIILLDRAENTEEIREKINEICNYKLSEVEQIMLNQYIYMIIADRFGKKLAQEMLSKINKESEVPNMLIDVIDREIKKSMKLGEKRGEKKGEIKGRNAERREIIIQMIKNDFNDDMIRIISNTNDKELKEIRDSLS